MQRLMAKLPALAVIAVLFVAMGWGDLTNGFRW
jgi:hypothetical protein